MLCGVCLGAFRVALFYLGASSARGAPSLSETVEYHLGTSAWRLAHDEVEQEFGVGVAAGEIVQCWTPTGVPNPHECSFTPPADGVYNFVWGVASSLGVSFYAAVVLV